MNKVQLELWIAELEQWAERLRLLKRMGGVEAWAEIELSLTQERVRYLRQQVVLMA